jgi:hypothetical protein
VELKWKYPIVFDDFSFDFFISNKSDQKKKKLRTKNQSLHHL